MRLVDTSGTIVAAYTYDPYGNILTATGDLAQINPLRYRGYYYDTELGMYYLNSRYYDPKVGRFINADDYVSTGQGILGNNMFAYCGNNPTARKDPDGDAFETALDVVSLAFSVAEVMANPADPWAWAGLSGDLVDVLLPFVGGLGESVRVLKATEALCDTAGNANDIAKAIETVATTGSAARKGKVGELLVGITTNSGKRHININNRIRIPDRVQDNVLTEVKNVSRISNTRQLRDFAKYADDNIMGKVLYVRPTTKVSSAVRKAGWEVRTLW